MKPLLTAVLLSFAAAPVLAQSVTFPTLTSPQPAPEPVTHEDINLSK